MSSSNPKNFQLDTKTSSNFIGQIFKDKDTWKPQALKIQSREEHAKHCSRLA